MAEKGGYMFAHQVIEDINKKYNTKNIKFITDEIKKSQKFHFGNSRELDKTFIPKTTQYVFSESKEYLKFPYDTCWFDYIVEFNNTETYDKTIQSYKRGFLIFQDRESVNIIAFLAGTGTDWNISDVVQRIEFKNTENANVKVIKLFETNNGYTDADDTENLAMDLSLVERSIRLYNCKNIQTEKISAPIKLNKKRLKSGRQEIFDYHVLNLVLPSNKKRGYQEQTTPLSHNRIHLCRGHFKEYTKEHPLFGKYTGLYWWEPSVRGQNKDGIVMKDYNIKTK